jgi:signal transduction histidine kinase/HAMP domain-containing protein
VRTIRLEQRVTPAEPPIEPSDALDGSALLAALRALRNGDFRVRLPEGEAGMAGSIGEAFNDIVELNQRTAQELSRISRAVGREGRISQRVSIGPAGSWARNEAAVNQLVFDLTEPMLEVSRVLNAVARGDLSQRMASEIDGQPLKGEYKRLADTINTMVDQLNAFASEVTRVAREVGTEGKLGGQADVRGVGGTWKDLTDSVNSMAASLTTQVRAIGEVATAVTRGDLSRSVQVDAQGEVELLKDDVNEMIRNLRETTQHNREVDWLKTNIARFGRLLQGQRDLRMVGRLILTELAPLVGVQRGVIYLADSDTEPRTLSLLATYPRQLSPEPASEIRFGEGLLGQCAEDRQRIHLRDVPPDYAPIRSGLGGTTPRSIVLLPVLFEDETRAVIELASIEEFSEIHLEFLDQLSESIGIVLSTITANMRAEDLVQEQAGRAEAEAGLARLRQVVDVMPEAILIADASGRVYLSNAAAEEIMGAVPESVSPEADGAPGTRRVDGGAYLPRDHPLARAVFQTEVVRGEQLVITNAITGREVPILVNSAPLSDGQGHPAGGVAVFQDISPLRDLDRQKDEFLAAISHDLKTPATIIKGNANLLQRALKRGVPEGSAAISEGLDVIDESTAQLVRLVDELLDLTRVRMGHELELDVGPADLIRIVRRLAGEYQKISPRHAIAVETSLDRMLGDWDEARIERIVANLISNAVKYSPRGGAISIQVLAEERDNEDWARLVVRDEGIGIPPAEIDRVFEPYYRASNIAGTVSGSGIGLAGTRHIVEQHGGEITVKSEVGDTTFTVCLPLMLEPLEILEA